METSFKDLVEVQKKDFSALFGYLDHEVECPGIPSASLRLHFVRHDASGEPAFKRVATSLVAYITQYCFSAKRREGLSELDRNKTFMAARRLFRSNPNSGQLGELMVYMFIEAILQAPQVLKKMPLTTSAADERKGSDGVHMRWNAADDLLEVIFAEAKLWSQFSGALADAFESMSTFHDSKTKQHEIDCFSSYFPELAPQLQEKVIAFLSGELVSKSREIHACLIGFDWAEYKHLDDGRRKSFVDEFDARYRAWAQTSMGPLLGKRLATFAHQHLRFEFFFVPFRDIAEFRQAFQQEL